MNERERLLSVFQGVKADRMPWYADLSYLYDSLDRRGMLEKKHAGEEGYLRFYEDMGAGICFYAPLVWKTEYKGQVVFEEQKKGMDIVSLYRTPLGSMRQVWTYLPTTYTWAITEHYIKSIDDLKNMLYVCENTEYLENYEEYARVDRMWGGLGIAVGIAPVSVSPLQKLLARWAGVEKTVELMMDYPGEFDEFIFRVQDSEDRVFHMIARSPAVLVEFPENLSSEITGLRLFKKYNSEYYTKRINQLHEAGKYVSIHIDGTLRGCFELLEEAGFDAAEAVTPAPVGDIQLEDLRKHSGSKMIIWGGLPGALFSPHYSEDEFDRHLNAVLATFKEDPLFVLGVADQVPPDGLISRVRKVRERIER